MRLLWARTFTISQMAKIIRYGVRRRFNEDVLEILRGYEKEDLRIAVIIAPIFIEIRLRTLISYALESRTVSRARFQDILKEDQWGFRDLLNLAWKLKIVTTYHKRKLSDLYELRNRTAHDWAYWSQLPDDETLKKLEAACQNAIRFMHDTQGPVG